MRHTMSTLDRLTEYLPWVNGGDDTSPLDELQQLLAEREAELKLEARYRTPRPNMTDEPTVVFPYTTFTGDGEVYGRGEKEFRLPDDGLQDADSPLVAFIADRHGINPEQVEFSDLAAVEGTTAQAELNEYGNIEVY